MQSRQWLLLGFLFLASTQAIAQSLPKVTGLALDGNQLTWNAQEGATGYNIHRDYEYFDTVRGPLSYTVVSFNDMGMFGVIREPNGPGREYVFVEYPAP